MIFCRHSYVAFLNGCFCVKCGKTKIFPCRHKWTVHNSQRISQFTRGVSFEQEAETLICDNCGKIEFINLTTGEKK